MSNKTDKELKDISEYLKKAYDWGKIKKELEEEDEKEENPVMATTPELWWSASHTISSNYSFNIPLRYNLNREEIRRDLEEDEAEDVKFNN